MVYHLSISVNNPYHVVHVLAELLQGQVTEFTNHEGSYVVMTLDAYGTMIEVHPQGLELVPGTGNKGVQHHQGSWSSYSSVHVAISVPVSEFTISEIGLREGWRVVRCNRAVICRCTNTLSSGPVILPSLTRTS